MGAHPPASVCALGLLHCLLSPRSLGLPQAVHNLRV